MASVPWDTHGTVPAQVWSPGTPLPGDTGTPGATAAAPRGLVFGSWCSAPSSPLHLWEKMGAKKAQGKETRQGKKKIKKLKKNQEKSAARPARRGAVEIISVTNRLLRARAASPGGEGSSQGLAVRKGSNGLHRIDARQRRGLLSGADEAPCYTQRCRASARRRTGASPTPTPRSRDRRCTPGGGSPVGWGPHRHRGCFLGAEAQNLVFAAAKSRAQGLDSAGSRGVPS